MTDDLQKIWEESPSQSYAPEHFAKDEHGNYEDPNIQDEFESFKHGWYLRQATDMRICKENIGAATSEDLAEKCYYNIKAE